jgi:protein-S-isoprenylcysteine O-methyltransferase Ste14
MSNGYYILIDCTAFILFALLHSFLASFKIKAFLSERIGGAMAFYRLSYNIFFLWLFFYLFEFLPRPDVEIFELRFPWDIIILIPQILALAGIIWTLRFFSLFEFAGLSQIKRWKNGDFNENRERENTVTEIQTKDLGNGKISKDVFDEKLTLKIEGPYKIVRHPLYLFTIIFLILRPTMDLFYLVFLIFLIAYFYIGSFYEEKKLVFAFGDQYRKYQESVPRLFPH